MSRIQLKPLFEKKVDPLTSLLRDIFKEINANVHSISVGIFSAEMACRRWYGADDLENYVVLRLSGKGKCYMVEVNNNNLNRFMIFKKIKDIDILYNKVIIYFSS